MENEKSLKLDVKFKFKDILRYNASVAFKSIANKVVLLAGLLILVYFFYKMFTRQVGLDIFISQNIIMLIIPVLIFVLIPWRVWQVTIAQMQLPSFAYGVNYEFYQDHIVLDIGDDKDTMDWNLFIKIVETKNDFRFYINAVSAQIIPKHNLSAENLKEFRNIIESATAPGIYKKN